MSSRNKRQRLEFDIGDYVRVNIPRVDRTGIDRRYLLCKVVMGDFIVLGVLIASWGPVINREHKHRVP